MGDKDSVNAELYQGLAAYFSGTVEQGGYNHVVNETTTSPFLATAFTRPNQGKSFSGYRRTLITEVQA